jgi:hypothetical protein
MTFRIAVLCAFRVPFPGGTAGNCWRHSGGRAERPEYARSTAGRIPEAVRWAFRGTGHPRSAFRVAAVAAG